MPNPNPTPEKRVTKYDLVLCPRCGARRTEHDDIQFCNGPAADIHPPEEWALDTVVRAVDYDALQAALSQISTLLGGSADEPSERVVERVEAVTLTRMEAIGAIAAISAVSVSSPTGPPVPLTDAQAKLENLARALGEAESK